MRISTLLLLVSCLGCGAVRGGSLDLKPCRIDGVGPKARCGSHRVFEDRDAGSGRAIDLNIVVLPAREREKAPDPIVFLHGGPGGAATALAPLFMQSDLRRDRDIVLVDQRGTGSSNPLNCHAGDLETQLEQLTTLDSSGIESCRDAQDADLRLYTTPLAVEDLEDVRKALGYPAVNLLGASYGTRVALEYMRRHPASVRTATLRGVAPPGFNIGADFARDSQRALDLVLDDCDADLRCHKAFPRLRSELEAVVNRLESRSEITTVYDPFRQTEAELTVTRDLFAASVHYSLYTSQGASHLPARIHAAHEGNLSPLIQYTVLLAAALSPQMSDGALFSAVCTEDVPFYGDDDGGADDRNTLLRGMMRNALSSVCERWPHRQTAEQFKKPVESNVPTMLISGKADPVTPPRHAERAARHLADSLHLVLPEGGHGDLMPGCVADLVRGFLDQGTTRGLDAGCVAGLRRPPFVLAP